MDAAFTPGKKSIQANAGPGAKGRSMIWNSIPLMTTVDVLIIAVTVYAICSCRLIGPSKRPSEPKIGLRWIALGLLAVCLYFFDLLTGIAEFGVRSIYNLDIIRVTRAAYSRCELEILLRQHKDRCPSKSRHFDF
jgi:hypothetical protein